jgi:hypothetical protein
MRFLSIYTPDKPTQPTAEEYEAMGQLVQEFMEKGILIDTGGLLPLSQGIALRCKDGKVSKIDGPFAESKEVVAGYAIMEGENIDDLIKACDRFFQLAGEGTCEIRPIMQG